MSRFVFRATALPRHTPAVSGAATLPVFRALHASRARSMPAQPTSLPDGNADSASLPKDKQSSGEPRTTERSGAVGGPTLGGTGGPTEQSGLADPEIPKEEAGKVKEGMTSTKNGPARK